MTFLSVGLEDNYVIYYYTTNFFGYVMCFGGYFLFLVKTVSSVLCFEFVNVFFLRTENKRR